MGAAFVAMLGCDAAGGAWGCLAEMVDAVTVCGTGNMVAVGGKELTLVAVRSESADAAAGSGTTRLNAFLKASAD